MILNRLFYISLLLFLTTIEITLCSQNNSLVIRQINNETKTVDIISLKKITFSGINLIVTYNNGTADLLATNEISNITFSNLTGFISCEINATSIFPNPSSHFIFIKNQFLPLLNVSIYTVQGMYVKDIKLFGNCLDISNLNKGVYLLKVDSKTFKFKKQ